jgi:TonB-dependent starch-binding outer membrane protein SusC
MMLLKVRGFLVALFATAALAGQLSAQATGTVSGRVIDAATQRGLASVTLGIAGRTAATDDQGRFTIINVPAGTQVLRATRIGYTLAVDTITVLAGQTTQVELSMAQAVVQLAEIVVTGYGESEKKDVTGVIEEVKAETFNTGRVVNAEELIRGKVAGVQVAETNGGDPNSVPSIRIRGGTSITSSNEPLYVVDGVPLPVGTGRLQFLNNNDIESFTVLKDASATAIYGSQGANGVVMITTKSGKGAVPSAGWGVTYRGSFSGSSVSDRPSIMNAQQFRTAVDEQAPAQAQYLADETTDWTRLIEQSAFGQEHTVAIVGGGPSTTFRGSLGYLGQEGVLQRSKNERILLNMTFNQLLFEDRLSLQANVAGQRQQSDYTPGGVVGAANNFAPTQPVYDSASIYNGYFEWDNPLAGINPVGELNTVTEHGVSWRSLGNLTAVYSVPFIDGLSATGRVGYLVDNFEYQFFAPSNNKNQVNRGTYGQVSRAPQTTYTNLFDGFLTYQRNLDVHAFTLTGGYAFNYGRRDASSLFAQDLSSDFLGTDGIPTAGLYNNTIYVEENKLSSWFGRVNYSFKDRYLLTASLRADGSSRFGPENQWGTFPSAAVAWRLSEEEFMGDMFSDLKLRFSWGKNGNQAFANYQQYKSYTYSDAQAQVQFGDEFYPTIRPSAADPNLKWEETSSWNLGLDYGFSNNRFTGALEYYDKKTEDLIFTVLVPSGVNLSNVVTTNVGSMKNKGFELTLNAALAQNPNGFRWDANLNAAYNKNELLQIDPFAGGTERILAGDPISGGVGSYIQVLQPGQPVNSFFVYEHVRDANGNPIWEDVNGDGVIDEQDIYVDINEDGQVNQDDRRAFNKPAPDWIIGFSNYMKYKSFDMSVTFLAQLGNYVYNNVASNTGHYQSLTNSARPNNLHTSVIDNGFETPQYFSDVYVEDASFLRLQNIELGYTFPSRVLNGMRVFGVAQNLLTLTGYSGVDPTASITGIDNNRYPAVRTFTAGVSIGF